MSANEVKCYTQINEEKCVFTWVMSYPQPLWSNWSDAKISSSVFNVGSDNSFQFQLQFYERTDDYKRLIRGLNLCCLKRSTELPCDYKISIILGDKIGQPYQGQLKPDSASCKIFDTRATQLGELISSTGTVTFRCELVVFTGNHNISSNNGCVDNNETPKLQSSKFNSMFLDEKFSDVKIRTACGKEIPAHRVVLVTASPVFKNMLEKKNQSVDIVDITYEAAVEMLRYIYTDVVENREVSVAIDLLAAAEKYQLKDMKIKCEQILSSSLSTENVINILYVADKYSMKSLKIKAGDFIKHNISTTSNSDEVGTLILSMAKFSSK